MKLRKCQLFSLSYSSYTSRVSSKSKHLIAYRKHYMIWAIDTKKFECFSVNIDATIRENMVRDTHMYILFTGTCLGLIGSYIESYWKNTFCSSMKKFHLQASWQRFFQKIFLCFSVSDIWGAFYSIDSSSCSTMFSLELILSPRPLFKFDC